MLQQTQVSTVIPYYNRFIQHFPTLQDLAEAPIEPVLSLWSGLGYYKRARQLKESAEIIVKKFDNQVPNTLKELLSLPGIGRYTAGAILSIAFNLPYPILDGNVIRVLSRVFAIRDSLIQKKSKEKLWQLAEELIPENYAREFNQALMELGALICFPKEKGYFCKPCPLQHLCLAYEKNLVSQIPLIPEKRRKEKVYQVACIIMNEGKLFITQRSDQNLLKGMWEVPFGTLLPGQLHQEEVHRFLWEGYRIKTKEIKYLSSLSHSITFRSITCYVYQINISKEDLAIFSPLTPHQWVFPDKINCFPHSSLLKKIISLINPDQQSLF